MIKFNSTAAILALALALPSIADAQMAAPATATKAPKAAMKYDCTKAGNKNKAVCKSAATTPAMAAKPSMMGGMMAAHSSKKAAMASTNPNVVKATLKNGKVINLDCSKKGNLNKKACKK